ncbi:shikimate dehydrogenase [Gryllotalpicola protaetiae]|uniref:Shikimate dehydrogenase n=1 Tax=Gryllotalpicola protaetiae TaxID=2419771 RepID=A0A387BVS3_9MICO|nr:shikimate dehydrogenase [Gryllotalpicola protaetiae]AYG04947.1 shikimate dehydrogenase [Gryllotalpicola protaetiae]
MSAPVADTRLAVLGKPIGHSKSPTLHAAAYEVLGLQWIYERHEVDESTLASFVKSRDSSWRGLSLTMPLKQTIQPHLDQVDRIGELTGAVNTVLFEWGGDTVHRSGFNTDVPGIVRALGAASVGSVRRVHVLGGGATAASAIVAASELGAESALVSVRAPERAAGLVPLAASVGLTIDLAPFDAPRDDEATELLVSTLPGGVEAPLDFSAAFRARVPLLDVAYEPWPTTLGQAWADAGGVVLGGLAMLVHQALLQVRIFVAGDPFAPLPDEESVLAAMLAAVGLAADGTPLAR